MYFIYRIQLLLGLIGQCLRFGFDFFLQVAVILILFLKAQIVKYEMFSFFPGL